MAAGDVKPAGVGARSDDEVLGSWKEIAQYLRRDVRTVMRWERTRAMPVHRLPGSRKAPVHALKSELDEWRASDAGVDRDVREEPEGVPRSRHRTVLLAGGAAALVLAAAALAYWAWKPTSSPQPPIRSVAVLPFQNLSTPAGDDYLVAGIEEMLTTELAQVSGLAVTARTSVARFAGTRQSATQIARELQVDALVEGSVLRSGSRVLVTAQLVRADTDKHVWAAKYERDLADVLGVVRDVAGTIAGEVGRAVEGAPGSRTPARPVVPEALDLYLRGRYAYHSLTPAGLATALTFYTQALAVDGNFALAWVGVSATRTTQAFMGFLPPGDALPEARDAARRALVLDHGLGEAHAHLGYIALYFDRDFDSARTLLERAMALSPGSAMVRHEHADYLLARGRVQESLEEMRAGREKEPPSWPGRAMVLYHAFLARRYDILTAEGPVILQAVPGSAAVRDWLARALWMAGRHAEALDGMQAAYGVEPAARRKIERAFRSSGPRAAMLALARCQAARQPKDLQGGAFKTALLFAAGGDADEALAWLERSDARREPSLLHAGADPFFDPIRADPRFLAFLERIGIIPAPR